MITEQANKFKKTVAAMLAAGTLASPAAAGSLGNLKNKFVKPKSKTQQVVQDKNTVNYLSTISDKLEDNYDDNQNDKNLQVTPMKDFLEDLIDKEGADIVKAAIDLLNTDYYHLSIDGHDGRSYSAWKKLYDSMITEDALEEEISKKTIYKNYFPY